MRIKTPAVIVSFVLFALVGAAWAQQSSQSSPKKIESSTATSSSVSNENFLIAIQKKGGDPSRAGDVKIEFYGHDAFKITSPDGLSILTDPWRNDSTGAFAKWFLRDFPTIQVDIVLSTHAHFDHDAVERPRGLMVLERVVGDFKLGDVEIVGLADKHACDPTAAHSAENCPPNNVMAMDNAIAIVQTGGLRIAVWGDNRATPDPAWDRYLKDVDVLILPVEAVLQRPEAERIIEKYDPKAVIPSHYFVRGLTTKASGLESVDGWVNEEEKNRHADVRRLESAELVLHMGALRDAHRRIYFFADHAAVR